MSHCRSPLSGIEAWVGFQWAETGSGGIPGRHILSQSTETGKYRVFTEDLEWSCVATAQHVRRQGRQLNWKGLLGSELRGLERHGANLTGKGKWLHCLSTNWLCPLSVSPVQAWEKGLWQKLAEEGAGSTARLVSSPGNKVSCNSDPWISISSVNNTQQEMQQHRAWGNGRKEGIFHDTARLCSPFLS